MADVRLRDLNPAVFDNSVGIGTASPSTQLHVVGNATVNNTSSNAVINLTSNSNSSILNFTNSSEGAVLRSDTYIRIDTNGSNERIRVLSDGKVGIGTTSPTAPLTVHGPNDSTLTSLLIAGVGSGDPNITFNVAATDWTIGVDNSVSDNFVIANGVNLATNPKISITTGGNVGIGTTAPANLLHVLGNSANGEIKAERASGAVSLIQAQASLVRFGTTSNHNLQFFTNDTGRVTITNAGLVGIGTTSPTAKLHVDNTTGGDDIKFETSTDHDLNFVLEAGTSNNQFSLRIPDEVDRLEFMSDSNIRMTLLDNGNFGIGTTSPTETLHVNGNVKITGSIDVGSSGFDVSSGFILPFGGGTAPSGWLECNGQVVSRSTYSALFAIIGTIYGAGDGSTTFAVPDLQGRVIVGQGGNTALRTPTDLENVGDTFGSQTHTLTEDEMPKHRHQSDFFIANVNHPRVRIHHGGVSKYGQPFTTFAGGDQAHNNIQPSIVINYLIKT